jgi:SAM-dependent methyltransferase
LERRANTTTVRDEVLAHLSESEADALGTRLAAGADHYRAWVGPPYNYDINGAMQFMLFLDLGLREYHRFLEIGCGSLRAGRFFMTYLLPERYFGVEPNKSILEKGLEANLGGSFDSGDMVALKRPRFTHNSNFDFSFTKGPVDFVVAQSIASHTGVSETHELLRSIASVCHEKTVAMVTFVRCHAEADRNTADGWFYPETVRYTDAFVSGMAKSLGLHAYRTKWPLLNQRPDGLVTTQTPIIFSKSHWVPTLAHRSYGIRIEGVTRL